MCFLCEMYELFWGFYLVDSDSSSSDCVETRKHYFNPDISGKQTKDGRRKHKKEKSKKKVNIIPRIIKCNVWPSGQEL